MADPRDAPLANVITLGTRHVPLLRDFYRSLGWPDGGRIATGALADLTTVSLQSVRTAGTTPGTALAGAVFAAAAADVTDVVVGGEHVVRDRRHRSIDVTTELDAAIRAVWDGVP